MRPRKEKSIRLQSGNMKEVGTFQFDKYLRQHSIILNKNQPLHCSAWNENLNNFRQDFPQQNREQRLVKSNKLF